MQKYGHLANRHIPTDFKCEICGNVNTGFNWSNAHGEAMCNKCGVPYLLLQYDKDKKLIVDAKPKITIADEYISFIKKYWNEHHNYIGLGCIMVARDYPECIEGQKKFLKWLEKQ